MAEVLAAALAFPTVLLTIPLGVVLLYWLLVVAGAFELPTHGTEGGLHLDHGGLHLDHGGLHMDHADIHLDHGGAHVDGGDTTHGGSAEGLAALLTMLRLNSAPLTVVFSVEILTSWLLCMGSVSISTHTLGGPPGWLLGAGILLVVLLVALPITVLAIRPLGGLFQVHEASRNKDFLGRECIVDTGKVDKTFGWGKLEDGGAGLLIQIRNDEDVPIRRGDRVLLLYWDESRQAYVVEPMGPIEGQRERVARGSVPAERTSQISEEPISEQSSRKEQAK